ncbi:MAG: putative metal-binding motif-containing protein [Deltaproteobacteria bacterium]|nr:putative metal-binding motif-containing protein [Deltaproteobacteria bacterium]
MTRRFTFLFLLSLAACGDDAVVEPDADTGCAADSDCDDGSFCNGDERCGADGCEPGTAPCAAGATCDEAGDRCEADCTTTPDADGDGHDAVECGGDDCDDSNADANPSGTEVCDADGVDEDCDPSTLGGRDADADGYESALCCNGDECGPDCDDGDVNVHPTEAEECDGIDQDCDGTVDEGVLTTFTLDADGDGHATSADGAATMDACVAPAGYARATDDCDDTDGSIHPGAFDRCDDAMVDDDCSGTPNDPSGGCECTNGDTRTCPFPGVCASSTQLCVSGVWGACGIAPTAEICANDLDEDCDGAADDGCTCDMEFRVCGSDVGACVRGVQRCNAEGWGPCVDEVPASPEICNGMDDDCDGATDEGVTLSCWADGDGDGFALASASVMGVCAAECPDGTTAREPVGVANEDCLDSDARTFPGQTEFFAHANSLGFDFDCDGSVISESPGNSCEANPDGSCRWDEYYSTNTADCGEHIDVIYCWADGSDPCEEVAACLTAPGARCRRLACR